MSLNPSVTPWAYTQGLTPLAGTTITLIRAGVTDKQHCLTSLQVQNVHATVDTAVSIIDDTATLLWVGFFPGVADTFANPPEPYIFDPPLIGTVGKAISIKLSAAASVYWNAQGFDQ